MDKLKMESKNSVQANIEKIKTLFPNAVTEVLRDGKVELAVDFDVLKQEMSVSLIDDREERYQFTWPDKRKSILLANTPIRATLRPCKEESVNFDTTENLYIEGDNLDVLKLLQETYLGKVKMIYIDPPYNTGNDFVYNDDFAMDSDEYAEVSGQYDEQGNRLFQNTESNGRFHTDWLNMLYPRIKVAKDILSEDGVICISIDDNEITNLRKICDEIFGQTNFVAMITVIVKTEGRRYGFFAKTHETMFVYAKNIELINLNEIEVENAKFDYYDDLGGFNLTDLRNQNARAFNSLNRPNLRYPFYVDVNNPDKYGFCKVSTKPKDNYVETWAITVNGNQSVWRWGKETAEREINNIVSRKGSDGIYRIYQKYRKLTQTAKTVWFEKDFISNKGTKELQELLGIGVFDFPKPLELIKRITDICSDKEDIVLDFFSGSATTAHAVMQLNAEDGGNRKFIMVQLPEKCDEQSEAYKAGYKTICEIGKERIRRAGKKVVEENGLTAQNLDIGFRVLKLDSSNMKDVFYNPQDYTQSLLDSLEDNIKPDRTPLDLLFQVMLELGKPLSAKIEELEITVPSTSNSTIQTPHSYKVFNVDDGDLIACFDNSVTEEVVKEIAKKQPLYAVFRDSSFDSDSTNANFDQIFATYSPATVRKVL
ncbi:MAG: site-specific DNA-methyltransferase [Clostridia bacterium]|nr:site-specific DNA-methyltransferase [Clostridia bacterium]